MPKLSSCSRLTLLALGSARVIEAQTSLPPERIAVFDARLPQLIGRYHIATVGAAVIRAGQIVWVGVYGQQGPGVPASTETLFNIASMTKPIAAETILRLVSAGRLPLDLSMAPDWVDPDLADDPRHGNLTPRIALSHRTGFPNWRRMSPNGKLAFEANPGIRFGYSGEGYNYVARFAEKRTGSTFEALADQYVFRPIGMSHTAFSRRDWMDGHVAIPMDTTGQWGKPDLRPEGKWSAADDIFTTVRDYATFLISVMKGEGLDRELAADRMQGEVSIANQWPCLAKPADRCPTETDAALGWFRFDYGDEPLLWHGGDDWGEHGLAYFYPGTQDGYVVLINGGNGRYAETDALDLLDDRSPVPAFAGGKGSPLAAWMRALLDAAYAGKISGKPKS
jgi:CubicO group peptidase (beta-lactamase class C family)